MSSEQRENLQSSERVYSLVTESLANIFMCEQIVYAY